MRFLGTSLLLSFLSYSVSAQFNYGVKAGPQFSTVRPGSFSTRASFHAGMFASYRYSERISFIGDVLFSDEGYASGPDDLNPGAYHFQYFDFPLTIRYRLSNRLSLDGIAEYGLLISGFADHRGKTYELSNDLRKIQSGWGLGISYKVSPNLTLSLRNSRSFSSAFKPQTSQHYRDEYGDFMQNPRADLQTFQISLAYSFRRDTTRLSLPIQERRTKILIGFRQGISDNTLVSDKSAYVKNRTGYEAGIDFRFETGKYFYLTPGIFYQQRGAKVMVSSTYHPVKLSYLSFPLVVGFSPVKTKVLTLSAEFGYSLNYQLRSENIFSETEHPGGYVHVYKTLTSKIFGAELATDALPPFNLFLNYRRISDTGNVVEREPNSLPSQGDPFHNVSLKNRSNVFTIGIRLKMKRAEERKHSVIPHDSVSRKEHIKPFTIGVKAGGNLNNTYNTDTPSGYTDRTKGMVSFHAGLYFKSGCSETFLLFPNCNT